MRSILITAAALAVVAAPLAAPLQAWADPGHGHRGDWRDDRGDDRRDWREDGRRDWREHREWRGRAEWKSYGGPREGYWYAPGYGYRPVSRGVVWRRGTYLPAPYRAYYVQEPVYYGLAPAPRGYRWVYGDDSFVLMAVTTGLIAQVVLMQDRGPPPPPPPPPRYVERYEEERYARAEPEVVEVRPQDTWRGSDGAYHCKKPNGTTGLVVGAAAGALVGRALDGGRDRTTGTVVGAAGGALLGREVERNGARCQ